MSIEVRSPSLSVSRVVSVAPTRPLAVHSNSAVTPFVPDLPSGKPTPLGTTDGSLIQGRFDRARANSRRFCTYICQSAFHSLAVMLVNAAISVALSWLSALSFTTGNIFSGSSPSTQSHRTFLVGVLLWAHLWFCSAVWVGWSVSLFRMELISHPGRPAGAIRVLGRMFRRTLAWFLFSGGIVASIGYGLGSVDVSYRKYRLELYSCAFWVFSYMPFADRAARRIYRNETVQGRERHQQQQQQQQQQQLQQRPSQTQVQLLRPLRRPRRRLLANSSLFISLIVPIFYVHVISFGGAISSTQFVRLFTLASLVFKVVMQEVTKFYIIRNKIQNARAMALLVAIPTMLIDTQVRIVLLRFQDATTTMSTSVAIALSEFAVRVSKALLVKYQIYRRWRQRTAVTAQSQSTPNASLHVISVDLDFEHWRAQLHRYHAIEVSADMYAEYLAIGCSSAIMAMLGPHPRFLLTASDSDPTSVPSSPSSLPSISIHLQSLTQVAMEVVVDLASCVVEISSGLPFAQVDRERGYFLVLCVTLAFLNVSISAILYLAY